MVWTTLIRLNALTRLPFGRRARRRRAAARFAPASPRADHASATGAAVHPDEPPVCGWFESSHALSHGLQVTELERPDEVAPVVPLRWWLAWELDGAASGSPFVR